MEMLSWTVFLIAAPAVIFAGVSKAGFGSGAAFASSSILALALDPAHALGVMLPLLMLIDVGSLPAYWKKWRWTEARVLLVGSLPGILLGALFFRWADPDAIRLLIGAVCLLFVLWQGIQASGIWRPTGRMGTGSGVVAGLVLGFTSFVSHAGGPAAAMYLLARGMGKTEYQATTVLVFWAVNLAKFFVYLAMGIFTFHSFALDLALAPLALFGTWLGIRAHHLVPERVFFGLTYVMLTLTGAKLIWDALA